MAKGRVAARGFDLTVDGQEFSYAAGQRVPEEHADLVTNEKIWTPRQKDVEALERMKMVNATLTDEFFEEYGSDDDEDEDVPLVKMTKKQLQAYAEENEIDIEGASTKAEILTVIEETEGE